MTGMRIMFSRWSVPLAYDSAFSISPLLVLSIAIAGLFFHDDAQGAIVKEISDTLGRPVGEAVGPLIVVLAIRARRSLPRSWAWPCCCSVHRGSSLSCSPL